MGDFVTIFACIFIPLELLAIAFWAGQQHGRVMGRLEACRDDPAPRNT